ncbi:MAG: 3-oxoacyl-ACP reductase FabG [Ignavibacteriales bacterium]|nr:MAG: 3-oxoacyl-ACP reductase FabG [Ignavibacteriaceae bacterium]MBW7871976.1 3-oxoacyl-ACP reductase FabG [Ignavibacteria bacterium]MCZ2144366.1 3-oxoacyl-ACP reductase FabG [Ignavibacteriales bacterium]OQY72893.1 MAG: 3-oxoacyl-ACP reductase [Ignavibacteriales bacterium UTCHB3]MBV6446127.1 3-oxoacyl-[acyl-carrier-protein] reductase FabG [Ignavibacteriaceae bacterium]
MKRLENKRIIVTGGARGIGKAAVLKFIKEGASVAIWDVNEELGGALVNEITTSGGKAVFFKVDVTDLDSTTATAVKTAEALGGIDVLVNNAGITRDASLAKMTAEQWKQVIDVNLTGVFNCTKAVMGYMVEQGSGKIINTSSVVGLYGNFGQTNYVATKSGVIGMTKVWARELGRKGICVNAVAPGFIATEMVDTIPEKVINMLIEKTPLGRLGSPEDIANAYLFLASDDSNFVNGTVLSVDGGLVM